MQPFVDPGILHHANTTVRLERSFAAEPDRDIVPAVRFGVFFAITGSRVGSVSYRHGDTEQLHRYAGHIGYGIDAPYRGQDHATNACRALRNQLARYKAEVIITCDPENRASRRVLDKIGATYLNTVEIPRDHFLRHTRGMTHKRRYRWMLG
ncbi:MAG: GNAT family N-acetyltransferase [Opitutales bacterium]|nr:GNAT family N-acetyltransferase [Opitutales bacterium]